MSNRKHLTPNEVDKLLAATQYGPNPERDYCLILMCFMHGCRVSEINGWRLSDIDLNEGNIYVNRLKNGFSTIHPLYARERKALRDWLKVRRNYRGAESEWLFLSVLGNRLSRQRIYWLMRNYSNVAELEVNAHPHMLRHGCGFALADRGIDTRLIQDFLGHRNIQNTVLYTASNAMRFKEVW
ncbi:tyrosine-type DNA invertase [Serratia fonticola]|uniref:tyrosine-type DNA invertase n=1 Tax=Serratia fonticola TaxID=47917 RepID=UPI0027FF9175|nr:tyrosine-type DNA invertase [Serratia fonticola]MDQ7212049.1 tyrosine-type DNA invertase [Serratia fonticola]HBE9082896.1 tyrosine-type recombinase/integrase [Serratia fonticola]HBE9093385.1 tyrosine-type recombinase/integrase [Serratia fonticola]HBE9155748.1 tyrosine-type recombinase/integrase [Serratia fonticola]